MRPTRANGPTMREDWRVQLSETERRWLRIWFWSIAAMTLAVLVVGGITRLTHSGLSMVDWKPLVGVLPPLNEGEWTATFDRYRQFPEYQQGGADRLGAFVAGLKAGLVFNTFPLMAGSLVPPNLLWLDPAPLNFVQNAAAVQWVHRLIGTILAAASLAFYVRVRRAGADRTSRRLNAALVSLIGLQYLSGILTLLYAVPISLAVVHQATALAIAGVWVAWLHHALNLSEAPPARRSAARPAHSGGRRLDERTT